MPDDSTEPYPPLRATSWAVLGLLSFDEELSGYDMKKWADWSLRFFYWAPSYSQVYGELHKLEELGLVTSRIVDKNDVRGKRLYRITPEGERAVTAWANESPADPAVLKHGVMLRMWLGHTADPDRLREVLVSHREQSERMRVRAVADIEGAKSNPNWAYPEVVLKWSAQYYADECARADTMLADLDRLAEERTEPKKKRRKKT
jgi:DNA-binding PadR family transcriptional regulator